MDYRIDSYRTLDSTRFTAIEIGIFQDMIAKIEAQSQMVFKGTNRKTFGESIALIHSELSEALEAYNKDLMDHHLPHRKGVEVELADAIYRIFLLAAKEGYDIASALAEKKLYNQTREDHKPENRAKQGGKKLV